MKPRCWIVKLTGWFNLSAAAFSALRAIHGGAGFDFNLCCCALNIMSAGIMFTLAERK